MNVAWQADTVQSSDRMDCTTQATEDRVTFLNAPFSRGSPSSSIHHCAEKGGKGKAEKEHSRDPTSVDLFICRLGLQDPLHACPLEVRRALFSPPKQ